MFTVRPVRPAPGFRVGIPGNPPAFRLQQDGSVSDAAPDFAVEEPSVAEGPDTGGLTPVRCTTTGGDLNCTSPGGTSFHPSVPAPKGFPPRIDTDVTDYHGYGVRSDATQGTGEKLRGGVIASPTPGPGYLNKPATDAGTLNEATPGPYYNLFLGGTKMPPGTPLNPVRSYIRSDQNGNPVVVNVTEPGHSLFPGYVMHSIVPSPEGPRILTEGEGLGELQGPDSPEWVRNRLSNETWSDYQKGVLGRSK